MGSGAQTPENCPTGPWEVIPLSEESGYLGSWLCVREAKDLSRMLVGRERPSFFLSIGRSAITRYTLIWVPAKK